MVDYYPGFLETALCDPDHKRPQDNPRSCRVTEGCVEPAAWAHWIKGWMNRDGPQKCLSRCSEYPAY